MSVKHIWTSENSFWLVKLKMCLNTRLLRIFDSCYVVFCVKIYHTGFYFQDRTKVLCCGEKKTKTVKVKEKLLHVTVCCRCVLFRRKDTSCVFVIDTVAVFQLWMTAVEDATQV